jgi:hypothetical protein
VHLYLACFGNVSQIFFCHHVLFSSGFGRLNF